jgi:hypothetical protein
VGVFYPNPLPYKCRCEEGFVLPDEATSLFSGNFWQKQVAAPPKTKSGGSQRHDLM